MVIESGLTREAAHREHSGKSEIHIRLPIRQQKATAWGQAGAGQQGRFRTASPESRRRDEYQIRAPTGSASEPSDSVGRCKVLTPGKEVAILGPLLFWGLG